MSSIVSRISLLGLCMGDHAFDMTLAAAADLVGRDVTALLGAKRRKELVVREVDGQRRVHHSDLRKWLLGHLGVIRWDRSSDWHNLLGLLLGLWGKPGKAKGKAKGTAEEGGPTPSGEAPGALGPSSPTPPGAGPSRVHRASSFEDR